MYLEISDPKYWDTRYTENSDLWNLNSPNPFFVQFLTENNYFKFGKLLILGSGKGYDAVAAAKMGYEVTALDFSQEAQNFARKLAEENSVSIKFLTEDFFALPEEMFNKYDLIYEYVTFCSVEPEKLDELIGITAGLLKPSGKLISILFPIDPRHGGPPFSIDIMHFYDLASKYLRLEFADKLIPSIKPRKGKEVLLVLRKPNGKEPRD